MAHQILIVYCMSGRYQVTASAMINRALQVTKPADGEGSEVGCGGCGWRAAPAAAPRVLTINSCRRNFTISLSTKTISRV